MGQNNKLIIYPDASVLNRIFDDQTQPRIYFESSAVLILFEFIENNIADLVSSDILLYENDRNPFEERRIFVNFVISNVKEFIKIDKNILTSAKEIENNGIKKMDALHLACAEKSSAEYFLTCDDRIIKKYTGRLKALNPVDFVNDILLKKEV
jgi:predicted nucleic acid-binding protein